MTAWPSSATTSPAPRGPAGGCGRCSSGSKHGPPAEGHALRGGQLRPRGPRRPGRPSRRPATRSPATVPTTAAAVDPTTWSSGCDAGRRGPRGPPSVSYQGFPLAPLRRARRQGDWPATASELAEAGYEYVSDAVAAGCRSPVREAARPRRGAALRSAGAAISVCCRSPPCSAATGGSSPAAGGLYYHSYDFDDTCPALGDPLTHAGPAIAGRGRITPIFWRLASRYGSETCAHAARLSSRPTSTPGLALRRASTAASRWPGSSAGPAFRPAPLSPSTSHRRSAPTRPRRRLRQRAPVRTPGPRRRPRHGDRPGRRHGGAGPGEAARLSRAGDGAATGLGEDRRGRRLRRGRRPRGLRLRRRARRLLGRMGRAAPHVVASFPAPGLRPPAAPVRYGARGVHVHGCRSDDLTGWPTPPILGGELRPLGRAGYLAHFARSGR